VLCPLVGHWAKRKLKKVKVCSEPIAAVGRISPRGTTWITFQFVMWAPMKALGNLSAKCAVI